MSISSFPLHWPESLPRTERKASSQFRTSLSAALKNVHTSLVAFGKDTGKPVTEIVLSSNVGGLSLEPPKDSGIAAWFVWDGAQRCIAVDRYPKPEDNLQAVHHIIEARRTEMRHGGLHIVQQTFKGFTALPSNRPSPRWWVVLGLTDTATIDDINAAYRAKARKAHPDAGGTDAAMAALNAARDAGLAARA